MQKREVVAQVARFTTGTVSHGTMREQDLIPAFATKLRNIAWRSPIDGQIDPEANRLYNAAKDYERQFGAGNRPVWPAPDEAASDLLEQLFDALDRYAPDGWYFGAHPGDGSDYGFWPDTSHEE